MCSVKNTWLSVYCKKKMSLRKIQPTRFGFAVTKKVKHREEVVNVSLPPRAEEPIPGNCLCSHNVDTKSNQSNKLSVRSHKSTIDCLISEK